MTTLFRSAGIRKSGRQLYDYMKGFVYRGRITLPEPADASFLHPLTSFETENMIARTVYKENIEECKILRKLTLEYHREAVIVNILAEGDLSEGKHIYNVLQQEFERGFLSNGSQIVYNKENGEAMGMLLSCLWKTNWDLKPFEFDPAEWIALAGEIANEEAGSFDEAAGIWRNFLQTLAYHVYLFAAQSQGKDYILAILGAGTRKSSRRSKVFVRSLQNMAAKRPDNVMTCSYPTLPGMASYLEKNVGIQPIGFVPYTAFKWNYHGREVFQNLKSKEGITYMAIPGLSSTKEE